MLARLWPAARKLPQVPAFVAKTRQSFGESLTVGFARKYFSCSHPLSSLVLNPSLYSSPICFSFHSSQSVRPSLCRISLCPSTTLGPSPSITVSVSLPQSTSLCFAFSVVLSPAGSVRPSQSLSRSASLFLTLALSLFSSLLSPVLMLLKQINVSDLED